MEQKRTEVITNCYRNIQTKRPMDEENPLTIWKKVRSGKKMYGRRVQNKNSGNKRSC